MLSPAGFLLMYHFCLVGLVVKVILIKMLPRKQHRFRETAAQWLWSLPLCKWFPSLGWAQRSHTSINGLLLTGLRRLNKQKITAKKSTSYILFLTSYIFSQFYFKWSWHFIKFLIYFVIFFSNACKRPYHYFFSRWK